jgi:hypothetical protein
MSRTASFLCSLERRQSGHVIRRLLFAPPETQNSHNVDGLFAPPIIVEAARNARSSRNQKRRNADNDALFYARSGTRRATLAVSYNASLDSRSTSSQRPWIVKAAMVAVVQQNTLFSTNGGDLELSWSPPGVPTRRPSWLHG